MSTCEDPGRLARDAYTYLHLPIIAGIIATAVANDLLIAAPHDAPRGVALAMILGGPALYLLGESLFRWRMTGVPKRQRMAVAALLVLLAPELPRDIDALLLENSIVNIVAQQQLCGLATAHNLPFSRDLPGFQPLWLPSELRRKPTPHISECRVFRGQDFEGGCQTWRPPGPTAQ